MTAPILAEIAAERARQNRLRDDGRFTYTCADAGMTDGQRLACLVEETGEVARALLHAEGVTSDGGGRLRTELLHVATIAVAWMEHLT